MTILDVFEEARARLAVDDEVLKEARTRRDLIRKIGEQEFATIRTFGSGSLAHGTYNKPLSDADGGMVLDRRTYPHLGPDGEGPRAIAEEVRVRFREILREEYPAARFYLGGKRAIKIAFNEPVGPDAEDFTADMIVALTRDDGGLWIPNLKKDAWEASHPERHKELIISRNKATGSTFARILRLAKHANAHHGKTICSFNIAALGLECIESKMSLPEGLATLLRHAAVSLEEGLTEDPAGISGSISLNVPRRKDAAKRFEHLANLAREALGLETEGKVASAQRNWSQVLPDAVDPPADRDLKEELKIAHGKSNSHLGIGAGGLLPSAHLGSRLPSGRAFGGKRPEKG